jgi:hypothetical protein
MKRKSLFTCIPGVAIDGRKGLVVMLVLVGILTVSIFALQPATAGSFSFVMPIASPTPRRVNHIAVGDVNGDGRPDGIRTGTRRPPASTTSRSRTPKPPSKKPIKKRRH